MLKSAPYVIDRVKFIMITQNIPLLMILLLLSFHSGEHHIMHAHSKYMCV